jgi:hypothetical protein
MKFKHTPIYKSSINFEKLLSHDAIKFFLTECEGYIAGGLAEKEFNNLSISNYLKTKPGNYNGDVDIYFNSQEGLNKAIAYAYENSHTSSLKDDIMHEPFSTHDLSVYEDFITTINYHQRGQFDYNVYERNKHIRHVEPSCTDISYQVYIDVELLRVYNHHDQPVKVQLIGKDFIGPPELILNTFDFANVQIAYYIKDGQLFRCQRNDTVPAINKRLRIVNSHSPLLMHRIYKYITHRGYEGVTEESKQHIVDWLIRARSGQFKNPVLGITLWQDALNNRIIRRAIYDKTIPDDALALIIGKVITERKVYLGYRRYEHVKIDEAMEAIKQRSISQGN